MELRNHDLLTRILRTRPVMAASIFYVIGCVIGYLLRLPCAALIGCGIAIPIPAFFPGTRRYRAALAACAMLFFGAANFTYQWTRLTPVSEVKAEVSGRVCDRPIYNEASERLVAVLDHVSVNGIEQTGKLRLYLRNEDDPVTLRNSAPAIGQYINCTAHVWEAAGASNPGQFDFAAYLKINDTFGYATCKLENTSFGKIYRTAADIPALLRTAASARIDRLFPTRADIAKAFLIGDRTELSEEDRSAFSTAGIAHLLAISGMHISLLSYMLMLLLNRFLNRKTAFGITLFLLILYGFLIGFPPSLFRALFMFAMSGFAKITGNRSDPLTALALSMLVYLLFKPIRILSTGFMLSYTATAGILILYRPIAALLHVEKIISTRTHRRDLRSIAAGVLRMIIEGVVAAFSAQIAILPIVIYTYGSQSVLSFIAGLPAIPIAMAGYLMSIPAVITGIPILVRIADMLFSLLVKLAHAMSSLPAASVSIAVLPFLILMLWIITCIAASEISRIPRGIRRFLILALFPIVLISNLYSYITSLPTEVHFLDAGQADCAVIQANGKFWLVDTGDDRSPAADYLNSGNRRLKGIFLTHPHLDHMGGLESILKNTIPEVIYISPNISGYYVDEHALELIEKCRSAGSRIEEISAGTRLDLTGDVSMEVLAPPAGFQAESANDDSMLLYLNHGDASVLFTGDLRAELCESSAVDADILKIAHHGSADSLSEALLEKISPSACILSVGYNTYGHPTQQALDLIEASGARLYRTDECGMITCRLHRDGSINISTYLKQEDSYDPT